MIVLGLFFPLYFFKSFLSIEKTTRHHHGPMPVDFINNKEGRQKCYSKRSKTLMNWVSQFLTLLPYLVLYH